jgi:hypothetical protein
VARAERPRKPARRETGSAAFAALAGLGSAPPRGGLRLDKFLWFART